MDLLTEEIFKPYISFIESCKSKTPKLGHNHHIIPRHLGGDDYEENIILLGYKDHQLAHLILADCFPENSDYRKKNLLSTQLLNSWQTEKVLAEGWSHSEETKENMSNAQRVSSFGFLGKVHSDESKRLKRIASIGNKSACKPFDIYYNGVIIDTVSLRGEAIKYCKDNGLPPNPIVIDKKEREGYKILKRYV